MRTQFDLPSGRIAALDTHDRATRRDAVADPCRAALFVPGYTGSKEDFLPLLRPLADNGFRAVAIDQRGQYESQWAADAAGYDADALAADVVAIADRLGAGSGELHLVGHSFGGLISRAAVLVGGDRFSSLTLMSSGPAAITGPRRAAIEAAEPILREHGMAALWQHLQTQSQADPSYVPESPPVQRFLRDRFMANDPRGLQVMGSQLRTFADLTDQLSATALAKLVLHGDADDAWTPSVQAEMARRLGAKHVVIPAAAHSPAVENSPATLEALLEFFRHGD